ncbi:MAG: hypothetical protein J6Q67_00380 [Clostridia bacterium]|nr:hypothetical protein [Clostridia bacterium]
MEKQIIIQIKDKRATLLSENAEIVCGNSDYKAKFEFNDDDFSAYGAKTALFVYGKQSTAVVFEGDICPIPPLADCSFCLIGVIAGDVKTTTGAKVPCVASIGDMGDTPLPPTEDVYNQIMEIIGKLDPENTLDEEKIQELIKEVIEGEGIGGGLTVEEVKEIVATETEGKFTPSFNPSIPQAHGDGYVVTYNTDGKTVQRRMLSGAYTGAGTIPYRGTNGVIYVGDATADAHAPTFKQLKEYTAPIADHEKRIENLESTLLTYVEDTASAYEKAVPVGVAPNAILDMLGGASYSSKNLLNPTLFGGDITEDGGIIVNKPNIINNEDTITVYVTLSMGTYYLSVKEVANNGGCRAYFGEAYASSDTTIIVGGYDDYGEPIIKQSIPITFYFEGGENGIDLTAYIMLSQTENAPYEPYFEGLRNAPVTEIKSYGSNLFDPTKVIFLSADVQYIEGGFILPRYSNSFALTAKEFMEMTGLKEGDTFTTSSKWEAVDGETFAGACSLYYKSADGAKTLYLFDFQHTANNPYVITLPEDFATYQPINCLGIYKNGNLERPCRVTEMTITKGNKIAEYKPYSAEPIDTYTIPTQIQALDGYGKEGFVLDFDNKTATYQGKTTDVSAYLTDYATFKSLLVQGGGKLIFENTYKYAVPTTLTYVKRKE